MNKKLLAIMAVAVVIYTILLSCVGAFGPAVQGVMVPIGLGLLKWTGVLFGYAIAIFLPVRIFNAYQLNQQRLKLMALKEETERKEAEKNQEALRQRALEEAILKTYYKEDDDV